DHAIQRKLDRGQAPRHGNRRTGKHREMQPARGLDHRFGLFKAVRKVLIVVQRNGAAVLFEDLDTLLKELGARIEDLALVIARVVAVLGDEEHRIYCELLTAAAKGLGNRGVY